MALALRDILLPLYPDARPLLRYDSPFQLLVAVVLSAQTTDEQVNGATPGLFARWPDAESLAHAPLEAIRQAIRPVGFFNVKAGYIQGIARAILERHGGAVPTSMEELTALPGVGRKSAHLLRSACFGLPGIIPDTHFMRVLHRCGVIPTQDPVRAERATVTFIPESEWTAFSHALNRHGKFVCRARSPACADCPLVGLCPRRGLSKARNSP
jgi:endonuclease-3